MALTNHDAEPYILFDLAGTTYAVKSRDVLHMEMLERITPVPNAQHFLDGVVFSRGQVIPAVNLRARFGFAREPHTLRTRLLVVQSGERAVGLIVDSASEFRTISEKAIQPPDAAVSHSSGKFLSGIANLNDRLVLILDLQNTLNLLDAQSLSAPLQPALAS